MNRYRIGLVADTHIPEAAPDLPDVAYETLIGCDQILHCGDLHTIEVVNRLDRIAPYRVRAAMVTPMSHASAARGSLKILESSTSTSRRCRDSISA